MSFLRTMRLLKMLKMLRVIRLMRSMFELRLILTSIMGSLKSMFWSLVLLMAVLFMFSMVFVQASANHLHLKRNLEQQEKDEILRYWDGLLKGMITLFACSTGGTDWHEAAVTLMDISVAFFGIFCLYIAFFIFVILNTITALFVEMTIASAMKDYQSKIQNELEKKDEYIENLQVLFSELDDSGDKVVSMEEFNEKMSDARMQAFAASLGIEVADANRFFALLSDGGKKEVDLETFVTGCIRMKGPAMSVDIQDLRSKLDKRIEDNRTFRQQLDKRLEEVVNRQHLDKELEAVKQHDSG